jgi:hypothetical protein
VSTDGGNFYGSFHVPLPFVIADATSAARTPVRRLKDTPFEKLQDLSKDIKESLEISNSAHPLRIDPSKP